MELDNFRGSKEIINSDMDIFGVPHTDSSIQSGDYLKLAPLNSFKDNSDPIRFRIDLRSVKEVLDLRDSFLYLQVKILRSDGAVIEENDKVAPSNLFLHTLFQNVEVKFNDTIVAQTSNLYPYQAWITKQLTNGMGSKTSELSMEMYYKDTDPDDYSAENPGFESRMKLSSNSKKFELVGKICDGIFEMNWRILNNIVVDIELTRSSPAFCLSGNSFDFKEGFKVQIEEANFYVRKSHVKPELMKSIQQKLSRGKQACYPIQHTRLRVAQIRPGSYYFDSEPLFTGLMPEFLCIGIVSSKAYYGRYEHSFNNFQHYNLSKLSVIVDGEPIVYRNLEFDFKNNQYLLGYRSICQALEEKGTGNGINISEFLAGNTLYAYNICTGSPQTFHCDKLGSLRLEMTFSEQVPEDVTVIIMGQFQTMLELDRKGVVTVQAREY
jgi:hypothetical protein